MSGYVSTSSETSSQPESETMYIREAFSGTTTEHLLDMFSSEYIFGKLDEILQVVRDEEMTLIQFHDLVKEIIAENKRNKHDA